jgi:hypothetical protein
MHNAFSSILAFYPVPRINIDMGNEKTVPSFPGISYLRQKCDKVVGTLSMYWTNINYENFLSLIFDVCSESPACCVYPPPSAGVAYRPNQ